jgi:hypothetical protein
MDPHFLGESSSEFAFAIGTVDAQNGAMGGGGAADAHNGSVEAQNGAMGKPSASGRRFAGGAGSGSDLI